MQKVILSSLLLAGFNPLLQAQDSLNLPNLVVTATRSETPKNQLAAATTIYTRQDIERLQVNTVPELLKNTPGLDITQNGGYGKITGVFMRGTNSDHVLVLIDGIKVGSITTGTSAFEYLPIDQIERVEIIRGPQSSLYGSEAIGGVIQIFTRKGQATDTPRVSLDAGGGSYDTARVSGAISGQSHHSWYSLGVSHINSQGFDARQATPGAYGINQPDQDGYYNTGINARIGHRFDNQAEIEAFFMRAEGQSEFDGNFQNLTEFVEQVVGGSGSLYLTDSWQSTLRLGQSRDNNDNFTPGGSLASTFDSTRWNVSWLNELHLSEDHQLIFGSDYRLDEVDGSTAFIKNSRYDVGMFGELQSCILDNHFINASLRWDENEAFGDYVTGNIGWRYNWQHGISLLANFGNAFKTPTFNELYYPGYGNSTLQAEQSTSFEIGIAGGHQWGQWEIRAYHTDIDNLIIAVMDPVTFNFNAENVDKAQIEGIEAEISTQIMGWNNKLSLNVLDPQNRISNARLPRRADKTLTFDLSRSLGAFDLGAQILAQGYRFDNSSNSQKVAGYVTVDLRSAYHFNKHWLLSAKLNNLLDKQYQTVDTYNTADRNFFISIHYNN